MHLFSSVVKPLRAGVHFFNHVKSVCFSVTEVQYIKTVMCRHAYFHISHLVCENKFKPAQISPGVEPFNLCLEGRRVFFLANTHHLNSIGLFPVFYLYNTDVMPLITT